MASATAPSNPNADRLERPTSAANGQFQPSNRRHGPTTPLRRVSRGSYSKDRQPNDLFPLDSLQPAFAELSDAMVDLNANFEQLQDMHSSLARFSESFASFLYGLNMNAFCNEFPQVESSRRMLTCRRLVCSLLNEVKVVAR
jgi:DASH complex subunit DAM1